MKSVLSLLALTIVLSSAACAPSSDNDNTSDPQAKAFSVSACPYLAGYYESGDSSVTIKESRSADSYRLVLGQGADEFIIDGKAHSISAKASYQGFCLDGVVEIQASVGDRREKVRLYFNSQKQLIQEHTGEKTEVVVWNKK